MFQQCAFAGRADAGDLVKRVAGEVGLAARAMGADSEAMGLVAEPLDEVEHRIARRDGEGRPTVHMERLATGVAVGALGDADQG